MEKVPVDADNGGGGSDEDCGGVDWNGGSKFTHRGDNGKGILTKMNKVVCKTPSDRVFVVSRIDIRL